MKKVIVVFIFILFQSFDYIIGQEQTDLNEFYIKIKQIQFSTGSKLSE